MEFLIASTLTLAIITASGMALAASERSRVTARARDVAAASAFSILEQAAVLGCQLSVLPGDRPDRRSAGATAERCHRGLVEPLLAGDPVDPVTGEPLNDASKVKREHLAADVPLLRFIDPNNRVFSAALASAWVGPAGERCAPTGNDQPRLLERRVTLEWELNTEPRSATFTSQEALPESLDYRSGDRGGILVVVPTSPPEGTTVTLGGASGTTITRLFTPCDPEDEGGRAVAWFPYLPEGSYDVTSPGVYSGNVNVTAGVLSRPVGGS